MAKIAKSIQKQVEMAEMRKRMEARLERQALEKQTHKEKMELAYGLAGHPKANLLYDMAYEMGHSGGDSEIENFYMDLAELLK